MTPTKTADQNVTRGQSSRLDTPPAASEPNAFWDLALIQKYDLTGPRYTSYPTALKFHTDYHFEQWRIATETEAKSDKISLYIHIPFCDTICYYCGCNKIVTANHAHADKYLGYLKREIALKAAHIPNHQRVELLHFGGGTPTYLSDEQLSDLMCYLREQFHFTDDAECAIEIHPQTVNPERVAHLRSLGFNRVSLGIQDFNPAVQHAVNRYNSQAEVQAIIDAVHKHNYDSISIDLIYGLPLQSAESFAETLRDVIALSPDRISVFNYAHMPHLFKSQNQIDASQIPEPHVKLQILHESIDTLCANGYLYIGMDHFAKADDELSLAQSNGSLHRNFQGYATDDNGMLHAFGVSAISTLNTHYAQNVKKLEPYYEALDNNQLPLEKGYALNRDDEIRRWVINTLLCQFELDFAELQQRFDVEFNSYFSNTLTTLESLQQDGLIKLSEDKLSICLRGRLLARTVCKLFDYYANGVGEVENRFSRII